MQDFDPTSILPRLGPGPSFGMVHLMETHMPYLGTTDDFDDLVATRDYPDGSIESITGGRTLTSAQRERVSNGLDSLGLDRPGELIALYDAAVRYADRKVGRLVDALEAADRLDETLLFVTADHGESLFDHGIFLDHHGLYEQVFRVPLVTNAGGGDIVEDVVQLVDLAPTILDWLDRDGPPMDGGTLRPLVEDPVDREGRSTAFAEEAYTQRRRVVRTDRWKLIEHVPDEVLEDVRGSSITCDYCETIHGDPVQLFDLEADPDERRNLAEDHLDVVESLRERYEAHVDGLQEPESARGDLRYDHEEDVLSRLEAIGYR